MSDQLKAAGFSDDEIEQYQKSKFEKLRAAGFSDDEIMTYAKGNRPSDDDAIRRAIEYQLDQTARTPDGKRKPLTFEEAVQGAWGMSVGVPGVYGLANTTPEEFKKNATSMELTGEEPWYTQLAYAATQMAGDIPASLVGAGVGTAAGSPSGPGAVITGFGAATAFPAAMRATMIDAYTKGEFKSFEDFAERAGGIMVETAKGYIIGATGGAAGVTAKMSMPMTSIAVQQTAAGVAEVAAMTTTAAALEGRVPNAQDFANGVILLFGAKVSYSAATAAKTKLMDIYKQTGVPPWAVVEDAKKNPALLQEIMLGKGIPDAYDIGVDPLFRKTADIEVKGSDGQPYVFANIKRGENGNGPYYQAEVPGVETSRYSVSNSGVFGKRKNANGTVSDTILNEEGNFVNEVSRMASETDPARRPFIGDEASRDLAARLQAFADDINVPDVVAARAKQAIRDLVEGAETTKKLEADFAAMAEEAKVLTPNEKMYRGVTQPWDETARGDIEWWSPTREHAAKYSVGLGKPVGGEVVSARLDTSKFATLKESEYTVEKLHSLHADRKLKGVRVVDEAGNTVLFASFEKPKISREKP
jgi:hypothetical protein